MRTVLYNLECSRRILETVPDFSENVSICKWESPHKTMNTELPPLEAPFTPPSTPEPEVPEAQPVESPESPPTVKPVKSANGPARRRVKKLKNVTKHDIRRCGRRAGVKRLTCGVADEARSALIEFMTTIIRDATTYTTHASRKTVIKNDVMYALKKNGHTMYI